MKTDQTGQMPKLVSLCWVLVHVGHFVGFIMQRFNLKAYSQYVKKNLLCLRILNELFHHIKVL